MCRTVVVFDADNTLWDTDSVFRCAQLALVRELERHGLVEKPESQLEVVRALDEELMARSGHSEYDFRLLAVAATHLYSQRSTLQEAVRAAMSHSPRRDTSRLAVVQAAYEAFTERLQRIPPLYADTESVLQFIDSRRRCGHPVATILLSEGDRERLERILQAHQIKERRFFDEIMVDKKSKGAFTRAKRAGLQHLNDEEQSDSILYIAIGDSLKRDIRFANQAGFVTVYRPSTFKGEEQACEQDERPDYAIRELGELLIVLGDLGFDMSPSEAFGVGTCRISSRGCHSVDRPG